MKKLFAWLGVAMLAVLARPAYAGDPLKPYVVMVVDTSGSMDEATGSGPPSCGGTDTKLNHARCAIRKIVNSYGDMVFALGRFRMTGTGTTTANTFPTGCTSNQTTCSTSTDAFQLLTALVDGNNNAADAWVNITGNTCSGGHCSVTTATNCLFDADCPATETCVTADPEMFRANGATPIEGTLNGTKLYWLGTERTASNFLVWPTGLAGFAPIANDPTKTAFLPKPNFPVGCDPNPDTCNATALANSATCIAGGCCCLEQCRPYITIMLTDGDETCGGNADGAGVGADAMLRTDIGTGANKKRYRVETKPIGFGIAPGDTDIEDLAHAGGAANVGGVNEGFYASDEASLQLAISSILDDAIRTEVCNDLDDDCDGTPDEDFPTKGNACDNGAVSICHRDGTFVCKADGTGVTCNAPTGTCVNNHLIIGGVDQGNNTCLSADNDCDGIDDDCDGKVDEGNPACNCSPTQEICDGLDNDCDGRVDEASTNGPKLSRPCGSGTGDCLGTEVCDFGSVATGHCGTVVNQAFCHCTGRTPTAETCDGIDNNCDGVTDGFSQTCSTMTPFPPTDNGSNNPGDPSHSPQATNICHPGLKQCLANQNPFTGFSTCQNEVKPCNNPGNNAQPVPNDPGPDGIIGTPDDIPNHPNPTCLDGCNGLDDDCDGNVDEDFAPADCSNGCGVGTTVCTSGVLSCNSTAGPPGSDTSCDGVDQDCDNKFDEDFACADATPKAGFPATCNPKQSTCDPSPTCTDPTNCCCECSCTASGFCNAHESCVGGTRLCQGQPISQESCDCSDNNCNGQVDEGNLCAAGSICNQFCQCAFQCAAGEFPCPLGKFCKKETDNCSNAVGCDASDACTQDPSRTDCCCRSLCIADPCFNHPCPPITGGTCVTSADCPADANGFEFACVMGTCTQKQTCKVNDAGNQATCVPACDQAMCAPLICIPNTGECKPDDCTTFPERCSADQNCINGTCVTNLCKNVTCPTDQYCVGGNCVGSCADVDCPSGQRCRLGVCETDPCGHPCPFGQACNDNSGKCVEDDCPGKMCPQGQYCNPNNNGGTCEDDPCVGTMCPSAEQICRGGTCYDPTAFLPDAGNEVRVTTGGGGGCSTGGAGGIGLLLGFAFLLTRRRIAGGAK